MENPFSKHVNDYIDGLVAEMMECEAMIPITVEAAIEAGIKLRGAGHVYRWLAEVTDILALKAAQERDKRTNSIMETFLPKG